MDRSGSVIKKYIVLNAAPSAYIAGSNLNAMDDTSVSIETLMLDYEGYIELSASSNFVSALAGAAVGALTGNSSTLEPGFSSQVNEVLENIDARKTAYR